MPELAEVDYYRKRWDPAIGKTVLSVEVHAQASVFNDCDVPRLKKGVCGQTLSSSESSGKQMLFRFGGRGWLGIHLGMTGHLRLESADFTPGKHDHLVLRQEKQSLVFADFRKLGRIRYAEGPSAPVWWSSLAPAILSKAFTVSAVQIFLSRRAKAPIKAVLLMQERFPGIGNWMADEILWRAEIHPKRLAAALTAQETRRLWRECRWVCREALRTVGRDLEDPPESWLFPHRWRNGGQCPRTGAALVRETIGGRTTCWSPGRQRLAPVKGATRARKKHE